MKLNLKLALPMFLKNIYIEEQKEKTLESKRNSAVKEESVAFEMRYGLIQVGMKKA
jgi:hypothetical protein